MGAAAAAAAGEIITDLGNLGVNIANAVNADKWNSKNYEMQQEHFAYQKELQQKLFAREDNAIQRRVEDLKKAGLNPILASGSGAGAGGVVNTTAPRRDHTPIANTSTSSILDLMKDINELELFSTKKAILEAEKNKAEADADNSKYDALIKEHDYGVYKASGMPSTAGGSVAGYVNAGVGGLKKIKQILNENNLVNSLEPGDTFVDDYGVTKEVYKYGRDDKGGYIMDSKGNKEYVNY